MNETLSTDALTSYLRIESLDKMFGNFRALKNVSLDIYPEEFVCFLGPSGCGKTTLLRAIAGLDIQTNGQIIQNGIDISILPPEERDFGIVFQNYALFPNLSVENNIAFGLKNLKRSGGEIKQRVQELLQLIGLPDQAKKYPAQLSGGQQQRVSLARAIATSPGLLLLDEPLSALDAQVRVHLRRQIRQLQRNLGITTIMVTHDQEEALTMADKIVVMDQGEIVQIGSPMEIYRQPATAFVANFIGTMNFLPATVVATDCVKIGDVEFSCNTDNYTNNSDVLLAIRPEDIEPVAEGQTDTGNVISTHIESMEFLGSFVRARLQSGNWDNYKTLPVADLSINAMRRLNLDVNSQLNIALPTDRLQIYPLQTTHNA